MVNDIHPHWQEDERTVIGQQKPVQKKAAPVQARRHPAAIFGIGAVLVAGFFVFGGQQLVSSFLAQVGNPAPVGLPNTISAGAEDSIIIRITSTGMDPQAAIIPAGKTITWQNDSDLPHILTSETLREKNGELLLTEAIFPGVSTEIELAPNQLPGAYTYTSQTARDLTGQVVLGVTPLSSSSRPKEDTNVLGGLGDVSVFGDDIPPPNTFASSSSIRFASSAASSQITTFIPPVSSSSTMGQVAAVSSSSKASAPSSLSPLLAGFSLPKPSAPGDPFATSSAGSTGGVPINPYAVGSDRDHPYDDLGNRLDGQGGRVLHSGAPFTPSTGQELWLALFLSLVIVTVGSMITMRKRKA